MVMIAEATRGVLDGVPNPPIQSLASTMLWSIAAVFMLSLFGLALILGRDRVLWLLFDGAALLGALFSIPTAVFFGIVNLFLAGAWVLWLVGTNNLQATDLLFMFLLPLAGIPLSALRSSIAARRLLDRRITNWRMMPIHQLASVIRYLREYANCNHILTAELYTTDLGFWRSLLGVQDGRERLTALQQVLVALIREDGWAFLDYENARCRILLPDMGKEQWQTRFHAAAELARKVSITCGEVHQFELRWLESIEQLEHSGAQPYTRC